jgi:hypothetical protein
MRLNIIIRSLTPANREQKARRIPERRLPLAVKEHKAGKWLLVRRAAMPDRKSSGTLDYVVGYRRPPKATRFTAGQSGNPKGRPKGSRSVGAMLQDIIQQKIGVTENGKTRRISALEVMLRRLVNDAMRSDPRALKLLLSLVDRYGDSPEAALDIAEVLADDRAILAQYLQEPADSDPGPPMRPDDGDRGDGV